jgi:hypothetical protein
VAVGGGRLRGVCERDAYWAGNCRGGGKVRGQTARKDERRSLGNECVRACEGRGREECTRAGVRSRKLAGVAWAI